MWRRFVGGRIHAPALIVGNLVLFSTLDGKTYALRASDGQPVWRFNAGEYAVGIATNRHYYLSLNGLLLGRPGRELPERREGWLELEARSATVVPSGHAAHTEAASVVAPIALLAATRVLPRRAAGASGAPERRPPQPVADRSVGNGPGAVGRELRSRGRRRLPL